MDVVVLALVGKIIAIILAIPLIVGLLIGYFIGKAAGRIAEHHEFEQYATMSAQQGKPVMPPEPRRMLGRKARPRRAA